MLPLDFPRSHVVLAAAHGGYHTPLIEAHGQVMLLFRLAHHINDGDERHSIRFDGLIRPDLFAALLNSTSPGLPKARSTSRIVDVPI